MVVNPDAEKREELKTLESIKKATDFREMVRPISYRQNILVKTFAKPKHASGKAANREKRVIITSWFAVALDEIRTRRI